MQVEIELPIVVARPPQWVGMPIVTKLLAPWLKANDDKRLAFSIGGLVLLLVFLVSFALLFRLVTG